MVYLMCSLPSLTFGQVPPISLAEFFDDAKKHLSSKHVKRLESVDLQNINASKARGGLKRAEAMFNEVQHDISEIRTARRQNRIPNISRLPKAINNGNPLEREKHIMKHLWEELDTVEAGKTFTLTEVLVYKLKLQILSRLNSFDTERGAQILESVVNPDIRKEG
ncbi:MAG TPA: DUF2764 family protein [Draconibacterium sp.]|nr:DUF2764 family protein [Draconibacterium sp.]